MRTAPKRNLPTLEDVSKAAKVSTATVSRCLNEPDKVSEKTRERVMAAVEDLNYAPNFGARAIAANRTGIYGAVIPTMENAIFARGIEAFQKALLAKNATMLVASSDYHPEQEARHIRTLVGRGADGLLLIGFNRDPKIDEFLEERGIAIVSAWAKSNRPDQSFVGFDNFSASKELVAKALSFGHRNCAYITARQGMNDRASERVRGAKAALNEAGLEAGNMMVIETEYAVANGKAAALKILETSRDNPPTLIICGNDVLAVGAIQGVQSAGIKVPDDVSVIGFDDIELATVISPALTTVNVPHQEMGRLAAEALYEIVAGETSVKQIGLETEIVMRESLGPARKTNH